MENKINYSSSSDYKEGGDTCACRPSDEKCVDKMTRYIDINNINLRGIAVFDQDFEALIPLSDVRMALQMTPTADVQEINHGKWISNGLPEYKWACHCSECGWVDRYPFHDPYKYCPDCGAKMDKKE